MLLLYKRVFTVNTLWFRYCLYGLASTCIIVCIVFFCVIVFSCTPIRGLWDKSLNAKCYELRNVYIAHTALILTIDIAIVAVPMRLVWQTSRRKGPSLAYSCSEVCQCQPSLNGQSHHNRLIVPFSVCVINFIKLPYLARNPGADPLCESNTAY